jgi:hypothetical protein
LAVLPFHHEPFKIFKIGVLAGVIFTAHDKETVDKFTRVLVFDLSCHRGLIKER